MRTLRILLSLAIVALFSTAAMGANVTISGAISGAYTLNSASIGSNGDMTLNVSSVTSGQLSLSLNPTTLPSGKVGTAYSQTVTMTASGGTSPYTYSCSGSGVAGITVSYDGKCNISGTPSAAGNYTVQGGVTDSVSGTASSSISFSVASGGGGGGGGGGACTDIGPQYPKIYGCTSATISACTPQLIPAHGTMNYCFTIDKPTVNNVIIAMNSADWSTVSHQFISNIANPTMSEINAVIASGSQINRTGAPPWYSFAAGSNERLYLVQSAKQGDKYYVTVYNPGSVESKIVLYWNAY